MDEKARIVFLDGLRGVAILSVLLFHIYARYPDLIDFVKFTKSIPILQFGHFGVQLFFMISGFVIFMTLDRKSGYSRFLYRRWIRLFPAILIISLLLFFSASYFYERPSGQPNFMDLIASLAFIDSRFINLYTDWQAKPLEGSFWSLYVEMIFYFVAGFIYHVCGRKKLINLLIILYLFTISTVILTSLFSHSSFIFSLYRLLIIAGFMQYGWFIIGMIIYEKVTNNLSMNKLPFIIGLVALSYATESIEHMLAALVTMFLFIISFKCDVAKKLLSIKPLLFIGAISYPFYLLHEGLIISTTIKIINTGVISYYPLQFLIPIIPTAFVILFAWIIVKFIEIKIKKAIILISNVICNYVRTFMNKITVFNYNK